MVVQELLVAAQWEAGGVVIITLLIHLARLARQPLSQSKRVILARLIKTLMQPSGKELTLQTLTKHSAAMLETMV